MIEGRIIDGKLCVAFEETWVEISDALTPVCVIRDSTDNNFFQLAVRTDQRLFRIDASLLFDAPGFAGLRALLDEHHVEVEDLQLFRQFLLENLPMRHKIDGEMQFDPRTSGAHRRFRKLWRQNVLV